MAALLGLEAGAAGRRGGSQFSALVCIEVPNKVLCLRPFLSGVCVWVAHAGGGGKADGAELCCITQDKAALPWSWVLLSPKPQALSRPAEGKSLGCAARL